ncbi:MAG: plasmid pRiA4b ORF-3 family protein, partial [Planctomycetaceae bacterium]
TRDVTLDGLQPLIQSAMGWMNSHLYSFVIGQDRYSDPIMAGDEYSDPDEIPSDSVRLSELVSRHGSKFELQYEYDFGDGWLHKIKLESVSGAQPDVRYPRCVEGAQACPPEDIGGVWGFAEFVEAITNPQHERYDEFMEWIGPFNPNQFDAVKTTRSMRRRG